jgi:hypothetical protein
MTGGSKREARRTKICSTTRSQARWRADQQQAAIADARKHPNQTGFPKAALPGARRRSRRAGPNRNGGSRNHAEARDELKHLKIALADPIGPLPTRHRPQDGRVLQLGTP